MLRRILSMLISLSLIGSMAASNAAAASTNAVSDMKVYGMTVNGVTEPVGIDESPVFGWKLYSDAVGQKQTAYRIAVKNGDDIVWDSGRVESSDTVDIPYDGESLVSSSEYSWTVTVWDKNGAEVSSDASYFETGLLEDDAWDGTEWISVDGGADVYSNDSLNYIIESDIYITAHENGNNNACIYFNKADDYNFFMWQIKYTPADGVVKLRPHVKQAGSYSVLTTSDVTAYVNDIDNIYTTAQSLKIKVTKSGVVTYFNGQKVSEFDSSELKIAISDRIEQFGLRAHGEITTADSFKVTDNSTGTVIINTDFSDGRVYFEGTTVADGKATFVNNGGSGVTETFAPLSGFIPAEKFGNADYTIEADITINTFVHQTAGNITRFALAFNGLNAKNLYMWQFAVNTSTGTLTLTPHVRNLGSYKKPAGSIDVTKHIEGDIKDILTTPQNVKIHVYDGGVKTYLNGSLVSTLTSSQLTHFPVLNYIANTGVRVSTESGVADNYRITDYSTDKNGVVICDYNFDDGVNPFLGGTAQNGGIFFTSPGGESIWYMKAGTRELRYSVEADITVSSQAVGIIFGAKDAKNGYMWQLYKNSDGTVLVKPHSIVSGTYGAYSDYTVTVDVTDIENTAATLRIDVTPYSFTTYVNGMLVNTLPVGIKNAKNGIGIQPIPGRIGVRASSSETGTVDNIKVTDYTKNAEGDAVYSIDFNSGSNPFISGDITDGALYLDGIGAVMLNDNASHFYKKFESQKPVSAKLYTTGSGVYNVFVNGTRVGNDELKPGFTDAAARRFYHSFDVTALVKDGENIISAISTGGWWTDAIVGHIGKKPAFRAKLILTYEDGGQTVIGTDTSWQADFNSPVVYADIYTGEIYDATVSPDYNGKNAVVNTEFSGVIEAHKGARTRVRGDLERQVQSVTVYEGAVNVTDEQYGNINVVSTYDDGEFTLKAGQTAVIDFGQNFAGWEAFTVSGTRGTTVTVRHAEALNDNDGLISRGNDGPEGSVYTANLRSAKAITKYTLSGDGEEYYNPSYSYYGFRYIEITATADVAFHSICGQVLTSVETDSGKITTSDADVNQLISNSVWGMYSNYVSVPTDCPQRDERAGWTADTQVFSTTASYLTSSTGTFLAKWLQDLRDNQMADGQYAGAVPTCKNGKNYGAFGWADAGIIVPYNIYKMYGDTELIKEHYASMQSYVDGFLATTNKAGAKHTYGDWLSVEENSGNVKMILGVAFYAWDALMMSEMAAAIGKTDDAARYMELYETEKAYFTEQFVNDDGTLCDSRQSSCLYALYLDLLPDQNSVEKVSEQLINNIESVGNKLQTGFLGTAIILPTLTKIGRSDVAYKLLLQHDYPSWLYTVDNGATTMWERWNSYTADDGFGEVSMNSFNHYAYGAVTEWMFSSMAGIAKGEGGYSHFTLTPYPDSSMNSVIAEYDSVNGLIKSAWKYEGDEWSYTATVPANTTATVKLPVDDIGSVYVNGKSVNELSLETDGIEYVGTADGEAEFSAVACTFTVNTNHSHVFDGDIDTECDGCGATRTVHVVTKSGDNTAVFNGEALRVYWGYIGTENTEYKWFNDFKALCGDTFTPEYAPKDGDEYALTKAGFYRFVVKTAEKDYVYTVEVTNAVDTVPEMTGDGQLAQLSFNNANVKKVYWGYIGDTATAYSWNSFKAAAGDTFTSDFGPKDSRKYRMTKEGYYRFVVVYVDDNGKQNDLVYTLKCDKTADENAGKPVVTVKDNVLTLEHNDVNVTKMYIGYVGTEKTEITTWTEFKALTVKTGIASPADGYTRELKTAGCYAVLVSYTDENGKAHDIYYTFMTK